jgi:hypothetical protein
MKKEKNMSDKNRVPWFLWPFKAVWDLLEWIIKLTGRLVAAVIGLVIVIVGFVLTILVISAPIGIPLMVFGFLLMIRGIF